MAEKPSIFISASAGTKTGVLRTLLKEIGVRVADAFDFTPGDSLNETITSRISKADGVIVVYSSSSSGVAFEMGVAIALKKPTFILVDPLSEVPSFVQSCLYLRSALEDTEILRASLGRFVQDIATKSRPMPLKPKRSGDSKNAESIVSFLDRIRALRSSGSPLQIEELVTEILKKTGLQVESRNPTQDAGVDCVVWSNQLSRTMGNPILIEVKAGNLDSGRLADAKKHLQRYLEVAGAHYAVLLYLDRSDKRFGGRHSVYPTILQFDLEDFVQSLQDHPVEEVLLTERNRIVHGGPE